MHGGRRRCLHGLGADDRRRAHRYHRRPAGRRRPGARASARGERSSRRRALRDVLSTYDHKDLDALDDFAGLNTTVEVVARAIFRRYVAAIKAMGTGACAPIKRLEITVKESDVAAASYFEEDDAQGVV